MEKRQEDTQAFSFEELERRGREDPEISLHPSNLADPVDAAEAARVQEESSSDPDSTDDT